MGTLTARFGSWAVCLQRGRIAFQVKEQQRRENESGAPKNNRPGLWSWIPDLHVPKPDFCGWAPLLDPLKRIFFPVWFEEESRRGEEDRRRGKRSRSERSKCWPHWVLRGRRWDLWRTGWWGRFEERVLQAALVGASGGGEEMAAPPAQYAQWSAPAPQADGPHDEVWASCIPEDFCRLHPRSLVLRTKSCLLSSPLSISVDWLFKDVGNLGFVIWQPVTRSARLYIIGSF